jgi:hypothetical protein
VRTLIATKALLKETARLVVPAHSTAPHSNDVHIIHRKDGLTIHSKELFDYALRSPAIMDSRPRALLPPVVGLDGDFVIDEAVIAPGSATRLVGRQKQTVDRLHGGAMLVKPWNGLEEEVLGLG